MTIKIAYIFLVWEYENINRFIILVGKYRQYISHDEEIWQQQKQILSNERAEKRTMLFAWSSTWSSYTASLYR